MEPLRPDAQDRAELFSQGFDAAMRQNITGDRSRVWLENKIGPILDRLNLSDEGRARLVDDLITEILDTSLEDEADSDPRPDTERGMFGKFYVKHMHDPEGKHDECRYFVLDPQHDQVARDALAIYEANIRPTKPKLADDIRAWLAGLDAL